MMNNFDDTQLTLIAYHMNWPAPGNDPWYAANPTTNNRRRTAYGVNAIPDVYVDGVLNPNPLNASLMQNAVNSRLSIDSPLQISIETTFDGSNIEGTVSIEAEDAVSSATLHIALAETFVHWNTPAPNGMRDFHHPMVAMLNTGSGQPFSIEAGQTLEIPFSFPWNDSWDVTNLTVISFVQRITGREIVQSANTLIDINIPLVVYNGLTVDDNDQWRPNDRPDAGETVDLLVNLRAHPLYLPASNISGTLTCNDPTLTLTDDSATWPDMLPGEDSDNTTDPFTVTVPEGYAPRYVDFTVHVTADGGLESDLNFTTLVGVPDVLLVNDNGATTDYIDSWHDLFDAAGFIPDYAGGVEASVDLLNEYHYVIWATGIDNNPDTVIDPNDFLTITNYLDNGGHLLLTSQYAGDIVGGEEWFQTYFAAAHALDEVSGNSRFGCQGVEGGPFPEANLLLAGAGGAGNSISPSSMTALEGGEAFYHYFLVDDISAVGHQAESYSTVYLGFPLEAVSGSSGTNPGSQILLELLGWMGMETDAPEAPGTLVLPTTLDVSTYPNPFNPSTTVSWSLPSTGDVKVLVFNSLGQRVATLFTGRAAAGLHRTNWRADTIPSGVYWIQLDSDAGTKTVKTVLLK